jgi:hypothetical protein
MKEAHIVQDDSNEHVFIVIECPERPAISIDVTNIHGRRGIGVRIDGTGIFGCLADLKELPAKGAEVLFRYCQFCGEKLKLSSSRPHHCEKDFL